MSETDWFTFWATLAIMGGLSAYFATDGLWLATSTLVAWVGAVGLIAHLVRRG